MVDRERFESLSVTGPFHVAEGPHQLEGLSACCVQLSGSGALIVVYFQAAPVSNVLNLLGL